MKKVFYLIITALMFLPIMVSNAAIKTVTTCENPTYDENNRQIKVCYLEIDVAGNSKFQTLKGKFTLTNTTFKVAPVSGDSRVTMVDNGNYNYTFKANSPISNQKVRLAVFTVYLSANGKECKVVWSPIEYINSYCEYKDGNYYDLNGNIVSETEYKKQCEKHYCEIIDGTYYDKNGNAVSKADYDNSCNPTPKPNPTCKVVDGTYYDKNGNSVTAAEYKKQCEKHYCEVVDGTYFDKNGNTVSKADYDKSCSKPTCKIIDGTYYDRNSNVVTATEYDKQCNVHYCKIIDGTYFGKDGNILNKDMWENECQTVVPDTGGFFSATTAIIGTITLAGMILVSRKINKVKKI